MKKSYLLSAAICFSFFVGILSSDKVLAQREISTGIEEIVVTAQKREENLQDVPGHKHDCGRPGINGGYIDNKNVRFGVNCYGYKPKMTQEEKNYMENSSIYPRSMKDLKEQKLL